jgi:hypothetical protein
MDTWERSAPPIYDEPSFIAKSEAKLSARSKVQNSDLTEAKAPPLVAQTIEPANENSELANITVPPRKRIDSAATPDGELSLAAATGLKAVASFRLRTIAIFAILSFVAGISLASILMSKSGWNLFDRRPYQSNAASVPNPASAQSPPMAASAIDRNLSETANQLRSIGTEISSLRKEIGSLADELAQIRKAQEELIAAQAQLARKPQRPGFRTQGR